MHIRRAPSLLGITYGRETLSLTKRERDTLERAGAIADRARTLLRSRYGEYEAEGLEIDTTLAGIDHNIEELLSDSDIA